jgi:hypothetical protein
MMMDEKRRAAARLVDRLDGMPAGGADLAE